MSNDASWEIAASDLVSYEGKLEHEEILGSWRDEWRRPLTWSDEIQRACGARGQQPPSGLVGRLRF